MQLYLFSEQETKDPKIPGSEDYQELVWCDDMNIDISRYLVRARLRSGPRHKSDNCCIGGGRRVKFDTFETCYKLHTSRRLYTSIILATNCPSSILPDLNVGGFPIISLLLNISGGWMNAHNEWCWCPHMCMECCNCCTVFHHSCCCPTWCNSSQVATCARWSRQVSAMVQ